MDKCCPVGVNGLMPHLPALASPLIEARTVEEVLAALDGGIDGRRMRAFSLWRPFSPGTESREAISETMAFNRAVATPAAEAALKNGFLAHGPSIMARYAALYPEPFTFTEAMRQLQPTGEDRWIFAAYREASARDGLYCSFGNWILVYAADHVLKALTAEQRLTLNAAAAMAVHRVKQITDPPQAAAPKLTPREKLVLLHLSEGRSTAEIAHDLAIAPTSVQTLAQRANKKLAAQNRVHAVSLAIRQGLI